MALIINSKTVKNITISAKDVKSISIDGTVVWEKAVPVLWDGFYIENIDSVAGTITFENMSGKNIEYSKDATNWTTLDLSTGTNTISNVNAGDKVYLRGTNSALGSSSLVKRITADFNHSLGGNICSLLDKDNYATMTSITSTYAFSKLFYQDTKLVNAGFNFGNVTSLGNSALNSAFRECNSLVTPPDLSNVTSLGSNALSQTFYECRSLITPIDLSNVTSIGDSALDYAFYNCRSLTVPPDLSNVTSLIGGALSYAFYGCSSLTTSIDLSNVTSLGSSALSNAFQGCSSMTQAPNLSNVTSLGSYALQSAFKDCSSMSQAPDLSNVTSLRNSTLNQAFSGCSSLIVAPDLSSVTYIDTNALNRAFYDCIKLQTIYVPNVNTWNTTNFNNWVSNAGTSASNPQMIFKTQALLDACPGGGSGSGNYTKVLA